MDSKIFNDEKVSRAYIKLSLPLVFSMVITLIYNLADTFFVAQTNDTNIVAGVSLGMPLFTLLMAVGNIFGQGGASLISRLLGRKDEISVRQVSSFCFYITIITGLIITLLMLIFRIPLLYIIGANEETFFHASNYYFYLAIGAPAIMLSFIHSNLLRSEGMSKESMAGTIIGALVNIILDPIFISYFGWGAGGAAIATVIGYIFTDIFFIFIVLKKSKILSVNFKELKIPLKHVWQILGIGIPAAIVNLMQSVSVVLMNQFLLPYGNDKIAAMGIVLKVSMIALLLLTGLAFGGEPLFGYYYGAGDKKRLVKLLKFCLYFISIVAIAITAVIFICAPMMIKCFMNNQSIIEQGTIMLRFQVITMVFVGLILLMTIIFQSMGKVVGSFILSISRQGIIFLAVLIISYHVAGYMGIIMSQAISDGLTVIIAFILFYKQLYKEFF
ncbi:MULTISPECIES: MATE family efflux transporter [Anaerofustis]|uniref:MATE family efflux transporter n=1 Tax=Anaerofustis TaxID=264995 RepID=UPI001106647F|nr:MULTISPECIES: MATE family efflux transporter [Anaerofustis]MCO8194152.1 MATE family efflux transporter [Anaerofustis sp. NSJ-163]